jgi:hypothetical protein
MGRTSPSTSDSVRLAQFTKKIRLTRPVLLMAGIVLLLVFLPFAAWFTQSERAAKRAEGDARMLSDVVTAFRSYYAQNVAGRIQAANGGSITLTDHYRDVVGGVPIPATLSIELGELISRDNADGVAMAFVSDAHFARRSRPALDAFQAEGLCAGAGRHRAEADTVRNPGAHERGLRGLPQRSPGLSREDMEGR